MDKHTPAPWKLMHQTSDGSQLVGDGAYGFITIDRACDGKNNRGEMLANARLIASAPELLEALKNLVKRIDINGGLGEYKGGPSFVMTEARQAIAKAEANNG